MRTCPLSVRSPAPRAQLGRSASDACGGAVARNAPACRQDIFMLPKAVIGAPLRGRPAMRRNWGSPRAADDCDGWTASGASYGKSAAESLPAPLRRPAIFLVVVPLPSASSPGLATRLAGIALPDDATTLSALQAKHPQSALPDVAALGASRPGAVPEFCAGEVATSIRNFNARFWSFRPSPRPPAGSPRHCACG